MSVAQDLPISGAAAQLRPRDDRRRHQRAAGSFAECLQANIDRAAGGGTATAVRAAPRPAGSRSACGPRVMALKRVFARFFLPYPTSRSRMVLWWIGNAVLLFVVLPVVIALLNRVLAAVERIRAAADDILARRRRAARRAGPGARAARHDRRDRAPGRRRRHPLRGQRRPAPAAEERRDDARRRLGHGDHRRADHRGHRRRPAAGDAAPAPRQQDAGRPARRGARDRGQDRHRARPSSARSTRNLAPVRAWTETV